MGTTLWTRIPGQTQLASSGKNWLTLPLFILTLGGYALDFFLYHLLLLGPIHWSLLQTARQTFIHGGRGNMTTVSHENHVPHGLRQECLLPPNFRGVGV